MISHFWQVNLIACLNTGVPNFPILSHQQVNFSHNLLFPLVVSTDTNFYQRSQKIISVFGLIMPLGFLGVRMRGIDLGRDTPCPVLSGNPLICSNKIMTYNENYQGNSQMIPTEAKTFQT